MVEHYCDEIEKASDRYITIKKKEGNSGWIMKVYDHEGEHPNRIYNIKVCPCCETKLD